MGSEIAELLPTALLEMSLLLGFAVLVGLLAQRVGIPLSAVLAVAGVAVAQSGIDLALVDILAGEGFQELLVSLFLPILVFEAALGLSTREFMRNLVAITALATVAVVISAALVGYGLVVSLGIPLASALLFGSLISATDPVAVTAVFRELGVSRRLLTLVEGESLLNDGVAIVLYNILLVAALGTAVTVADGLQEFVVVSAGGLIVGALVGTAAVLLLPLLSRLPAAALSVSVAFGSFVLAEQLGVSGVMATVAAGIGLGGMIESRADEVVRDLLHELWESLAFIANALLFLFVGLSLDPALLRENAVAVLIALAAVLISRPLAVVPVVAALERFAGVPKVGQRNAAVVVWGGLRGGVALALALSLPESLAERDVFVAMAGGVVLGTLLVNATTIPFLLHYLHLDEATRTEEHLNALARLLAVRTARERLAELEFTDPLVGAHLDVAEIDAKDQLERARLDEAEEVNVLLLRGLHLQRQTYQGLGDAGLLAPISTRTLLEEIDVEIEEVENGLLRVDAPRRGYLPWYGRAHRRLLGTLPEPFGEDLQAIAYVEVSARRLAARRSADELETFKALPGVDPARVDQAKSVFTHWEETAAERLESLADVGVDVRTLHRRQAKAISRIAAVRALRDLAEAGLLPQAVAEAASQRVVDEVDQAGG
jgi:CPA1 family monovalent cation:H+ antiporter